ncbi:MAG: HAD-IB family hydrolase [Cyclobacteriaceae bacterium]|nr:HAD-IB family hydrolase [Cyclobacteriaceae bacterium]
MTRTLALFDFDGTITRKDSFLEVIKHCKGSLHFYFGLLVMSPVLVLYKFRIIPNWRAKELFFSFYFKEDSYMEFQQQCRSYAIEKIPSQIRPSALQAIRDHQAKQDHVIVVTASGEEWVKPWTDSLGIEVIATRWASQNNKLTGKIEGRNCYGEDKKVRILEKVNPADYSAVMAYGDTRGDLAMLSLADQKFYKYFND